MTTDDNGETETQANAVGRVDASEVSAVIDAVVAAYPDTGVTRDQQMAGLYSIVASGVSPIAAADSLLRRANEFCQTSDTFDQWVHAVTRAHARRKGQQPDTGPLSLDEMSEALEALSDGKRGRSDLRRGLTALLTGAALTAQLSTADAADGRVYRWSRLALDLDDRQTLALDRAITEAKASAGKSDADTMRAVADALRADGFDEHLTDEGFFKAEVWAARTGEQTYSDGLTTWVEIRTAEEVGADESLRSWDLKPQTDDHPSVLVTPDNWREFAVGNLGQDAHLEPGPDGEQYVSVTILVGDLATMEKIRAGKLELSAGYTVIVVDRDGKRFQTKIRINHLALVDAGRAGPLAAIKIDGSAWQVLATGDAMPDPTDALPPPAADQLDPETSEMLLSALVAYLKPETPEAGQAALEQMANIMGLDPARIMEMLGATEPDPAAEPEPEADPDEVPLMDVALAEGITAKMTADAATAWKTHTMTEKTNTDAAAGLLTKVDEQATTIAALTADTAGLKRSNARLLALADERERRELIADAAPMCPDLVKVWRECKDHGEIVAKAKPLTWTIKVGTDESAITESPISTMRRAIVCDLDSGATADFARDHAKISHENWDTYVETAYSRETRRHRDRAASPDPSPGSTDTPNRADRNLRLQLLTTGSAGK